jgi:hypothetical protein
MNEGQKRNIVSFDVLDKDDTVPSIYLKLLRDTQFIFLFIS